MSKVEIKGTIYKIGEVKHVSEKFKKLEFIVKETTTFKDKSYDDFHKCELKQDKCGLIDGFKIGEEINVNANLKGNKYDHKEKGLMFFGNIDVWKIEKVGEASQEDETNDLPF